MGKERRHQGRALGWSDTRADQGGLDVNTAQKKNPKTTCWTAASCLVRNAWEKSALCANWKQHKHRNEMQSTIMKTTNTALAVKML